MLVTVRSTPTICPAPERVPRGRRHHHHQRHQRHWYDYRRLLAES